MVAHVELDYAASVAACPLVLPAGWAEHPEAEGAWDNPRRRLRVLMSVERIDGTRWLHVSMSHRDRLPTWGELREAKDIWIGRDRKAIQVLPPEAEYVNHNPNVLHLWCCLDRDVLPDFRRDGGTL